MISQLIFNIEWFDRRVTLPMKDDFLVQVLKTLLHLCHIHILPPRLLAFSGRLAVLLRSIWVARLAPEDGHFEGYVVRFVDE